MRISENGIPDDAPNTTWSVCVLDGCGWALETTPPKIPHEALGGVFGLGVMASVGLHQHYEAIEQALAKHLGEHDLVDFLKTIRRQQVELDEVKSKWATYAGLHEGLVQPFLDGVAEANRFMGR